MSKNITTRIAAGAAAAGFAAAMVAVGGGAASAAPITGSADAVADFVTGLGLAQVAKHKDVKAPGQAVTVNDDGTVTLSMKYDNEPGAGEYIKCRVAVYPALEAPADGVPVAAGVATFPDADEANENGEFRGDVDLTTGKLAPGVYAVSSSCSLWETAGDKAGTLADVPKGSTANQPHYFVTLGGLL